jgi:type IV pilus assembly protein PilN
MYSLDINFLKDPNRKPEEAVGSKQKPKAAMGDTLPIIGGLLIMVTLPALAWGASWWINGEKEKVNQEIAKLEGEIQQAEAQGQKIQQLQAELAQVTQESESLLGIFNQIQPLSALFQDLLNHVPQGVQINAIEQTVEGITIEGIATSYTQANDFLLVLKKSNFFIPEETFLSSVELKDNPVDLTNVPEELIVEFPQVVGYSVQTKVKVRPASEILSELERNGASGLVSRIKILQEKGVITQ